MDNCRRESMALLGVTTLVPRREEDLKEEMREVVTFIVVCLMSLFWWSFSYI